MASRSSFVKDDNFYKRVLNRSVTRFIEDLDTTSILDLLLERDFLSYSQVRDIQELPLTSTRAREILSKVASRGEKGYRIFKKLLRESKQEHLADYLGRQEIDLEKKLMAEKKNEDKGKQVELQVPAATVKANAEEEIIPDDKELIAISSHIGMNWEMIGPFLGVPSTTVDQICMDNSTTRMKIYRLLYVWRGMNGSEATVKNLLLSLKNVPDAVNINWKGLEKTVKEFGQKERKVDEGKARNTSEEKQTFAERETEMLLRKLVIAPTSIKQGSKPKNVSTEETVGSNPDKNQPNPKYNPSLEAMQGELGMTRRTGELYSNEYGPDLSGKSFPRKDMLMDPGVNVGNKGLTSDKGVLDPTYKSFQQIPPIESQIYQVQHGEVKKNHRYDEVGSDSDGESSSERQSEQFVSGQPSQLPTGIKNDSGGSDFKDNKKDDDGAYGGIQADVSGNYLVSDSKNNQKDEENDNALGNQNDIGGMRMDETDAGRRHSLEREIAQNLRQQQAIFTPARPTGGATSSPLVVANAGKEDPDKVLSSLATIKNEIVQIETQFKRNKGNDDTDATPLPDLNVVVGLNSRPLASRKHDATVRIIEERNERVKKIFDCDDEPKGRLKNLNEQNVKDLLELSDKKPGLKGGFGEIYVSREKVPGIDMQLVLKKVAIESDGPERNDKDLKVQKLRSLTSEKLCARAMHYGIVPLFGIQENSNNFYFLSPFMVNGNLNHAIEEDNKLIASGKPPKLDAFQRLRNMFQIASAIDFLHTAIPEIRGMIFHRDVKSLNIVLDEFLNARIIDFGLAREMKFGVDNTKTTRYYATPGYGKLTQQQIIDRHDDYRYFGVVMRELLTGKKPFVEACPEEDLMTQSEQKIRKRRMKMWKDLQVVPEVTGPLVTLSSECIENEEMTSDKLVSKLKNHLRNSNTQRWISRKQPKDVIQQGEGSKQTEKCDICLAYDAVEESVLQHHDCNNHIKVCVSCMRNSYCNPIHCHSCDTKVTPTIGHNWAALLIAGYDTCDKVAKSFKEDVKAIEQVISSKCPLVMGVSTSNIQTVCPEEKGKPDNMLDKLKTSKEALKGIKGVQTLLVYYSGHYKPDEGGFELVHSKEGETGIQYEKQYLSAEDFQEVISEILYGCEPAAESKRTIVFLDCCAGPAISPTKEKKSIPTSSGDTSQNQKLPRFTLSENVKIVQINASRPDQGSVEQQGGSPFRRYLVQCLTREALGAKCLNDSCNQCRIQGDFITIEKLLDYLGQHLDQHPKMEQYDPVMNSYNVSKLDAKIGYVVNFRVDLEFTFKLDMKVDKHTISHLMFTEFKELQCLLFDEFVEKMELDKSIGDEPKLDTTELYGMICIEVEKIRQRDKITTLDQLMTAWNAKRELLVTLRAEAEIYNGMVGKFLPNGLSVDPILKYLEKSDHVTMAYKDYITVAKVDIVKNFKNLLDDIDEDLLGKFDDHMVDIDNAMKQDKEEMKKVKELHIVFLCKINENGNSIHRSNFICYQLKREDDLL